MTSATVAAPTGAPARPRRERRGVRRYGMAVLLAGAGAVLALMLAMGAGRLAQLAYLPGALVLGLLLFRYQPPLYLAYAWWLWLLTPFVRRLVDHQIGWNPANPILTAPLMVTALCALTLVRRVPALRTHALLPFVLVLAGIAHGYLVGLARSGPAAATYALLVWLTPPLFAFHLAAQPRGGTAGRQAMERAILVGVLAIGAYGIYQFVAPPAWDRYWMVSSAMPVIGSPEPFRVRVFSTLNSPAPFAVTMMGGLLLLLGSRGLLRWPALAAGSLAFLLCIVRSAWVGCAVGLAAYWLYLRGGSRVRLVFALAIIAVLLLPFLSFAPIADAVESRVDTFTHLRDDASVAGRIGFYREMAGELLGNPLGFGLGASGGGVLLSAEGGTRDFDSGVLELVYTLGWLGGAAYIIGVGWLSARWLLPHAVPRDRFGAALAAVGFAALSLMPSFNSLAGMSGMVFWNALGLALAIRRERARRQEGPG